jgi:hypothetical protein
MTKGFAVSAVETGRRVETLCNAEFFNAYNILDLSSLRWQVSTYRVERLDGDDPKHEDRGKITDIIWRLRKRGKGRYPGYGFIIDVDEVTVAVPSTWEIPHQDDFEGYRIVFESTLEVRATELEHERFIAGILRDAIKSHFKQNYSDKLGDLWQDYRDFCQMPQAATTDQDVLFCRKFRVSPKLLKSGRWVIQVEVSTTPLDAWTFDDYYRRGEVERLADMIKVKRANRLTRKNEPTEIRVWCDDQSICRSLAGVLELARPEDVLEHALLNPADQQVLAGRTIRCNPFKQPTIDVPLNKLRLILETQIMQESHRETILEPDVREGFYKTLRDFLDGMNAYGKVIRLAANPVLAEDFEMLLITPPALLIRTSPDQVGRIPALEDCSEGALRQRMRKRDENVRKHGFLQQRPINPLLACQEDFGEDRAHRLKVDLNWILKQQGLDFRFGSPCSFDSVEEITQVVERGKHDTLFVVLPERRLMSQSDTYEKIKKSIPIPSQCIQCENTLPPEWVNKSWRDFREADWRRANAVQKHYWQCVLNLLVKHGWVPFAPADPFNYNIHVGIDVGGMHNNRVMACVGYGFARPQEELVFLPWRIDLDTNQAEPIPSGYLYKGLSLMVEELRSRLIEAGIEPDFNRVLFFRDGDLRGKGDTWNEIDDLKRLRQEFYKERRWIDNDSLWTTTELSKSAEHWRLLRQSALIVDNPIVGRCVFPFDDENTAVVCTTGSPYLSQGTASPLVVRIRDIYGHANREEVLRDLVWEADMCFTKIDTGTSLPWVLHVANAGALQLSKTYSITGITV